MCHNTTREVIATDDALTELVVEASQRDAVAIDTEFLWERTYYPRLGLIQLALSNEECFLIDPLAIDDLRPLGELLASKRVIKIFHDAPQDLIIDIEIDKSATRTNWLQRPLSEKQQLYAADDVRYLRAIRILLLARIVTPETEKWLQEELSFFDNPQYYDFFNPELRYKKIRGCNQLEDVERAILRRLCIWREKHAQQKDRPRGHIIKDNILLEIAKKKPVTITALQQTDLSAKAINNYGPQIIKQIKTELQHREIQVPSCKSSHKLTKTEKKLVAALSKYIQLKSDTFGIDPALVANAAERKELALSIETGNLLQDSRLTSGWRKDFLIDFMA